MHAVVCIIIFDTLPMQITTNCDNEINRMPPWFMSSATSLVFNFHRVHLHSFAVAARHCSN